MRVEFVSVLAAKFIDPAVELQQITRVELPTVRSLIARALSIVAAFAVGWIIYMIGMVLAVNDGLLSLIFQPIMAALWSGLVVLLSLLVGLVLRVGPISRFWNGSRRWAALIASASLFILMFGYFLGLTHVGIHPEPDQEVVMLHPTAAMVSYFLLVFSITNWPVRRSELRGKPAV